MTSRRIGVAVLVGLAALILVGCDPWAEPPVRQLKFSVVSGIDRSFYKAAVKFSDLVEERTHGKLIITVYPNAQLAGGSQLKELEMLREGKIDFVYASNVLYSNLDPKFYACSVPWLFSGYGAADKFLAGPGGRRILGMTRAFGIEGLALGENGFRQITNSRRAIRVPDDLRGLRIRVATAMYEPVYRSMRAEPVVMTRTAMYKALQEKAVDGQDNPVDLILAYRLYEVQHHITLWNYSYDAFILGANGKLYDGLDRKTQDILREAAREASEYQIRLSREAVTTQLAALKAKGMEVVELTPAQVRAFRESMRPADAEYEAMIGKSLIDELRAVDR